MSDGIPRPYTLKRFLAMSRVLVRCEGAKVYGYACIYDALTYQRDTIYSV